MAQAPPTVGTFVNAKLLEGVDKWHGDKGKYKMLRIQLFNYFDGIDARIRPMMNRCEGFAAEIKLSQLTPDQRLVAGAVRVALGTVFHGQALLDLETIEDMNGFEA